MVEITDETWAAAKAEIKNTADAIRVMDEHWSAMDGWNTSKFVEEKPAMAAFCLLKMTETLHWIQSGQEALDTLKRQPTPPRRDDG